MLAGRTLTRLVRAAGPRRPADAGRFVPQALLRPSLGTAVAAPGGFRTIDPRKFLPTEPVSRTTRGLAAIPATGRAAPLI